MEKDETIYFLIGKNGDERILYLNGETASESYFITKEQEDALITPGSSEIVRELISIENEGLLPAPNKSERLKKALGTFALTGLGTAGVVYGLTNEAETALILGSSVGSVFTYSTDRIAKTIVDKNNSEVNYRTDLLKKAFRIKD